MFRKPPKSALHGFTIQNNKCIEDNNTATIQLLFLLSKTHKHIVQLSSSVYSKYLQVEPDTGLSFLCNFEILTLKSRTPSTSLICLLNLNCYSPTEWSCNLKQTTTKHDETSLSKTNKLRLDSPCRES